MKTINTLTICTLLSLSFISIAHKDHGSEMFQSANITQQEATEIATKKVIEKVESKTLDTTWSSVEEKTAVLVRMNGKQVWKVTFKQSENKILKMYLTKTGVYISTK